MLFRSTITLTGGESVTDVVTQILSKNIAYLLAEVSSTGALKLTHTKGGNILFTPVSGTPLSQLGIDGNTPYVTLRNSGTLLGSNWINATYSASTETPAIDPMDGTYWYDAVTNEVDIMIHNGTTWKGYQTITNDDRGYKIGRAHV